MSRIEKALHSTLAWIYPSPCLGCGRPTPPGPVLLGLCPGCRERLRRVDPRSCRACLRPLAARALPPGYRCGSCRKRRGADLELVACWRYEEPMDRVIRALKFGGRDYLGRHLGSLALREVGARLGRVDRVVPVPLHWRRRLLRGYNQADEIARAVAAGLAVPRSRALRRVRATRPQAVLDRSSRQANVRNAFVVRRPAAVSGRRILLVDDVVTTGATLRAAAAALQHAGAASVVALASAHRT